MPLKEPKLITTDTEFWQPFTLIDVDGNETSVQNPLPVSGGSVYCQDLNLELSDVGSFSGDICTLFDNYFSNNVAAAVGSGGVNPKFFTLVFNRPILGSTIGVGSPNASISNAKLTLFGLAGDIIKVVNFSTDDEKRGILVFQFEQKIFISAKVEFFTDDEVTLGGSGITKSSNVSIDAINGIISNDNSTETPLLADAEFVGGIIDTKNYGIIICSPFSDVSSAIDGLVIEFSKNLINWRWNDTYTVAANSGKTFSVQPQARYMRVRYLNGSTNQGVFEMETQLKPVYIKPSSHRVGDSISPEDDSELVKSVLSGLSELTGIFENVATFRGALKVDTALVHKEGVNQLFSQFTGTDTTLAVAANSGDTDIVVVSVAGYSLEDQIVLSGGESERFHFHIKAIVSNTLTLDRPLDNNHSIGIDVKGITTDLRGVGTITSPESYKIAPPAGDIWQMTRLLISITDATSMDDGKFGGMTALPNGYVLRANINGEFITGTIWKTNGDMALDQYDITYTDKAPAGQNGLRGRWTFTRAEFVIELNGDNGDYLEILNQDVTTDLLSFNIKGQGRIFGG